MPPAVRRIRVQKEAFWLYGVIAGLAVREALLSFIAAPSGEWLLWIRLTVFLLVLTQFYLGAAVYFEDVHNSPENELRYSIRSFGADFVTGFFHTILFFWWSTTLANREHHTGFAFSEFLLGVFVVHGFCAFWVVAALKYDTLHRVALWAMVNLVAVLICFTLFAVGMLLTNPLSPWREVVAIVPIAIVNALQLAELFKGRPLFKAKLGKLAAPWKAQSVAGQLKLGEPQDTDSGKQ